jgi:hypothetical protein
VEYKQQKTKIISFGRIFVGPHHWGQLDQECGWVFMCPSKSQLEVQPITINPPNSSDVYSTDGSTPILPQSLSFLPMRSPTVTGDCRTKSLIVNWTYSAEPVNELVIPNCIITEKNGKSYVPILHASVQSVVFQQKREFLELRQSSQLSRRQWRKKL